METVTLSLSRTTLWFLIYLTAIPVSSGAQSLISGSTTSPIKILCLGDSITDGFKGAAGEGGYRGTLAKLLTTASCQFQFVGRATDNSAQLPSTEQAHDGFCNYAIEPTSGKNGLYDASKIDSPATDVSAFHPNVVLLLAGTDTLASGTDPKMAVAEYDDLLHQILLSAPNTIIVVGAIPHCFVHPGSDSAVMAFNADLKGLVAELQNRNYKIHFVPGTAIPKRSLNGGLYPSQAGYDQIAAQMYAMLGRL